MSTRWLLIVALILGVGFAAEGTGTVAVEGRARSYTYFVPDTHPAEPLPLLIVLHGRFGTGAGMAELTDLSTLAEREDFIVLYPDGVNREWNYVQGIPGYPTDAPNDRAFLRALVRQVSAEWAVDRERVYVAGFSNGGFMAQRLACSDPERYAGFASVAAAGFGGMERVCGSAQPVRLLLIHGTHDTNIPFNGLSRTVQGRTVPLLYSVPDTLAFWAERNGCAAEPRTARRPTVRRAPETEVYTFTFEGCAPGGALELHAVGGGGHNWPGHPGLIPEEVAGTVSLELDASEAVWAFFEGE